jgi:ABC-type transporter Mla subunit MlaD
MRSFTVLVYFPDATGVQKDTPVQYCGYQIGRVLNVSPPTLFTEPDGHSYHRVGVSAAIEKRYKNIPSNVNIVLTKRGLGSSYIELIADPDKKPEPMAAGRPETMYLTDGLVLSGTTGMMSEFLPPEVQKKIESLVDAITLLANNANEVIGDQANKANIKKTLDQIRGATEQASKTLAAVERFSQTGSEKIEQVAEQLDAALRQIRLATEALNSGRGTLGQLLSDGRLYENLLESSQELELALEQMKKLATDAREKGIRIKW